MVVLATDIGPLARALMMSDRPARCDSLANQPVSRAPPAHTLMRHTCCRWLCLLCTAFCCSGLSVPVHGTFPQAVGTGIVPWISRRHPPHNRRHPPHNRRHPTRNRREMVGRVRIASR